MENIIKAVKKIMIRDVGKTLDLFRNKLNDIEISDWDCHGAGKEIFETFDNKREEILKEINELDKLRETMIENFLKTPKLYFIRITILMAEFVNLAPELNCGCHTIDTMFTEIEKVDEEIKVIIKEDY